MSCFLAFSRAPSQALRENSASAATRATGLRLGILRGRDLEESLGEGRLRVGPRRDHGEELVVLELVVHIEPEQDDEQLALLHDDGHRRRRHVGGVGPEHQVDLVDVDELRVDAGNGGGIGLVVVVDELDLPPEEPALGVDLLLPDLHAEQRLLAVGRRAALSAPWRSRS